MLVFYSGWGYWQWYEESYSENEDEEIIYIQRSGKPTKACTFFELPKDSIKEITHLGKTTTKYLLLSKYTEVCKSLSPYALFDSESEHGNPQFILCEEWEYDYCKYSYEQDEPVKISVIFNKEDIKTSPADKEMPKNLTETERNTMLRLILGMAIDSYRYDPDSNRNTATGNKNGSITVALEKLGLGTDEKTISKYLKEAAERYPDAKPRKT